MRLNVNRFFSDRLIFDKGVSTQFRVANSFWDWFKRIISWVCSPASYSDENRRSVASFKKYITEVLGKDRLQRICSRYSLDLDTLMRKGSPLLSRDVAKIVVGSQSITVEDINESIQKIHATGFMDPHFDGKESFQDLDSQTLAKLHKVLSRPFGERWHVADPAKKIHGNPTEWLASLFYDPFLADRERLQLTRKHPSYSFETFALNMVARVIKREMDVGTLVPAPNHADGCPQFYYVSAKVISGEGMVRYILHPATNDTDLKATSFFRGTAARSSEISASSTVITDFERHLGKTAYESGKIYDPILQRKNLQPAVEVGHSMGSTLVQYRLANMDHIKTAYLFSGPGIPKKEAEKFNEKNPSVNLIVRHAKKDPWSCVGEVHLGYRAPSNVHLNFWNYHTPHKKKFKEDIHTAIWGRERFSIGIEGGISSEKRDQQLYHKNGWKEFFRSTLGPPLATILRLLRSSCRFFFSSREVLERGLKIGAMEGGIWKVTHFRLLQSS